MNAIISQEIRTRRRKIRILFNTTLAYNTIIWKPYASYSWHASDVKLYIASYFDFHVYNMSYLKLHNLIIYIVSSNSIYNIWIYCYIDLKINRYMPRNPKKYFSWFIDIHEVYIAVGAYNSFLISRYREIQQHLKEITIIVIHYFFCLQVQAINLYISHARIWEVECKVVSS